MARRISLVVKPNSRQPRVDKISESEYRVSVRAPVQNGKANEALIEALAEYLAVPKTSIRIVRGLTSRNKVIEVP